MLAALALVGWGAMRVSALDHSIYSERVYASFWATGKAANAGHNPYATQPETWHFGWRLPHGGRKLHFIDPNLSPPAMTPLFQWAAHYPALKGRHIETMASVLAFSTCAAILFFVMGGVMQKRLIIWLLFSMPVMDTIFLGQDYALLAILSTAAWLLMRRNMDDAAAMAIGLLVVMKPNFLVWPVLLLIAGRRRQGWIALGVFGVASMVPAVLYGPHIYVQWLRATRVQDHSIYATDVSLAGFFTRTFGLRAIGEALALVGLAAAAWYAWKRKMTQGQLAVMGLCTGMLCAPLAWVHYTIALAPWIVGRRWRVRETMAAVALMMPVFWLSLGTKYGGNDAMLVLSSLLYLEAIGLILWSALQPDWPKAETTEDLQSNERTAVSALA